MVSWDNKLYPILKEIPKYGQGSVKRLRRDHVHGAQYYVSVL